MAQGGLQDNTDQIQTQLTTHSDGPVWF